MEELMKYFTLPLDKEDGTITYLVNKIETYENGELRILLLHPLAKKILIPVIAASENDMLLTQTQTQGKSNLQKWIEYVIKNGNILSFSSREDAESLAMIFVVNRRLTRRQKSKLSSLTGEISINYFNGDLNIAIRTINENEVLLDEWNRSWFEKFLDKTKQKNKYGRPKPLSPQEREGLFRIAGFVLSQLEV
jgi:hypothetical protein